MRASSAIARLLLTALLAIAALFWIAGASAAPAVSFLQATPLPVDPKDTATATPIPSPTPLPGEPILLNGKVIFTIQERIGSVTPEERARMINDRLDALANNPFAGQVEIHVVNAGEYIDILADEQVLMSITEQDAVAAGKDRFLLAKELARVIENGIQESRSDYSIHALLTGGGLSLLATIILIILLRLVKRLNPWFLSVAGKINTRLGNIRLIGQSQVYQSGQLRILLLGVTRLLRLALQILLFIIYLPLLFGFFPWTRSIFNRIVDYVLTPLQIFGQGLLDYLPNLFFLGATAAIVWVGIKISSIIFHEIERGVFSIAGFDPEWAAYTHRLITILLIIFGVVVAFPYVPGAESPAFRGISLFLGVLLSLASSSAISNIIAGVILTYTGAFRLGDVIRVQDIMGKVDAKQFLVTRVVTFKNEQVSIPNSILLNYHVTNYSSIARTTGLILHTTVTIGYDVPWRQVHELMIAAAGDTPGVQDDPQPFVLQTSLNDYHISYELNVYTREAGKLPRLYSLLHQNIQDRFNAGGIEILSPVYTSLRDGNTVTIPEQYRPADYRVPGFKIDPAQGKNE